VLLVEEWVEEVVVVVVITIPTKTNHHRNNITTPIVEGDEGVIHKMLKAPTYIVWRSFHP
jgi:hypothetical protein